MSVNIPPAQPEPNYRFDGGDRPYFHGGPGWNHEGAAFECWLPHPGDADWVDQEALEVEFPDPDETYVPRHLRDVELENYKEARRLIEATPRFKRLFRTTDELEDEYGVPTWTPAPPKVSPRSQLLWVGVDLDGTIAQPLWTPENPTSEIGTPIWGNVGKLIELEQAGYKIVIHTSRAWTDYEAIETWLEYYKLPWHQIQCGKPLFALYVDDRGRHESAESWLP